MADFPWAMAESPDTPPVLLGTKGAGHRGTSSYLLKENKDIRVGGPALHVPQVATYKAAHSGDQMSAMQQKLWNERHEAEGKYNERKGHDAQLHVEQRPEVSSTAARDNAEEEISGLGLPPWRQTGRPRPPRRVIEPAITIPGEEVVHCAQRLPAFDPLWFPLGPHLPPHGVADVCDRGASPSPH